MLLLNGEDVMEVLVLCTVAKLTQEIRAKEREDLAIRVANAVLGGK